MPVRSLNSAVLKWPDLKTVDHALRCWAERTLRTRKNVQRIGYFGSYARGDWGVGSDLDLVIVIQETNVPFMRRSAEWDLDELPVPTNVLVYTEKEWRELLQQRGKFPSTITRETIWIYPS